MTTKLPTALERAALAVEASGGMPYIESQLPSVPIEYRTFEALPTAPLITATPLAATVNNLLKLPEALPTAKEVLNAHPVITGGGGYGSFKVRAKPARTKPTQKRLVGNLRVRGIKAKRRRKPGTASATNGSKLEAQKETQTKKSNVRVRVNPKTRSAQAKRTGHPKPTWLKKYQFKKGGK